MFVLYRISVRCQALTFRPVPTLRSPFVSPLALVALACVVAALLTPWTITIPRADATAAFGIQSPAAWVTVLAILGAVVLVRRELALASLLVATAAVLSWYVWAMLIVETPAYSSLDFPFVGTDLLGPGWYAASAGLLAAAASLARRYHESDDPPGKEVWILAAIPGFGLMRLGQSARGLLWAGLGVFFLLVATLASPMAPLFQPLQGFSDLPAAPPTRGGTWIPLILAVVAAILSVADTIWVARRRPTL